MLQEVHRLMSQDREKQQKVVDLSEARRRQRTVQGAATLPGGRGTRAKAGRPAGKGAKGGPRRGGKLWSYLQFLLFLAVLAYMMQLCRGP